MREFLLLTAADVRRVPWRNGRGVTEEILVVPDGATFERGDFDVRVSRATVAAPGPFSSFAGFDRVLVVTRGGGLVLDHGGHAPRAMVRPLEPYRFSGDWPTSAGLTRGAVSDFNVIVRRGSVRAEVRVLCCDSAEPARGAKILRQRHGARAASSPLGWRASPALGWDGDGAAERGALPAGDALLHVVAGAAAVRFGDCAADVAAGESVVVRGAVAGDVLEATGAAHGAESPVALLVTLVAAGGPTPDVAAPGRKARRPARHVPSSRAPHEEPARTEEPGTSTSSGSSPTR